LLGIHTNMPGIFPGDIDKAAFSGAPAPSGLSADEKVAYERLQRPTVNRVRLVSNDFVVIGPRFPRTEVLRVAKPFLSGMD
jgi:hypothetical protein